MCIINRMNISRKMFLWLGPIIGVIWSIVSYISESARWGQFGASLSYPRFLSKGGFITILIPSAVSVFIYFRLYYVLLGLILGIFVAIIWSFAGNVDVVGLVLPGFVISGFILGVLAQMISYVVHRFSTHKPQ